MVKESSEYGQKDEDDREVLGDRARTQHERPISIREYICCAKSKDSVIFEGRFKETLVTVLGQSCKERWRDVVVREWLWSPQNTFPLGSIVTSCVKICHYHLLYMSASSMGASGYGVVKVKVKGPREC